jgi:lactoylglutathione lyase
VDSDRPEVATDFPLPDSPSAAARAGETAPHYAPGPGCEIAPPGRERVPGIRKRTARQDNLATHDQTFPIAAGAVYSLGATNAKDTAMTEFAYDHVHLRSPDPEETARYYQRMFGAEIIKSVQSDGRERVDMRLGGVMMFIAKVEPEQTLAATSGGSYVGLDHLGLRVCNIDAVCDELKAKGAEFTVEPKTIRPGIRIAFVRGPQDVLIEILDRDVA